MFDTAIDIYRPRRVALDCYVLHNSAVLERQAPGEELGALLDAVDPADLDMFDLVSHIGA